MRCPNCNRHVTPFTVWVRLHRDDPRQCPGCGLGLRPTYRACWALPLSLLLVIPTFPFIPAIEDWLADALGLHILKVGRMLVFVPIIFTAFFVLWLTGAYVPGEAASTEGCESGTSFRR